jgi:hypothetical protein
MKFLVLILVLTLVSSCRYDEVFSNLHSLKELKLDVEKISSEELTTENQIIVKNYFSKINDIAYEVKNSSRIQKYIHSKFDRFFQSSFCTDYTLDQTHYSSLMSKCTVNGFYICAEEVRNYKNLLSISKSLFTDEEFNKISSDEKCNLTLKELGLIND